MSDGTWLLLGAAVFVGIVGFTVYAVDSKHKILRYLGKLMQILFLLFMLFMAFGLFWLWWTSDLGPWKKLFIAPLVAIGVYMFGFYPFEYFIKPFYKTDESE